MSKKEKSKAVANVVAKAETLPAVPEKKKASLEIAISDLDSFGCIEAPEQSNKVLNGSTSLELRSASHLLYLFSDEIEKVSRLTGYSYPRARTISRESIDLTKAEHVVINGTIVILLNGATFNIRDAAESWNAIEVDWINEGDVTAAAKPVIVLHRSKVEVRWTSSVKGKSIISDSTISINGPLYLDNAEIKAFHLTGEQVNVYNTTLSRGNMSAKNVTVRSSSLRNVSMSAKNSIYIEDYTVYPGSRNTDQISGTPNQVEVITIKPNHSMYTADFALPPYCRNRDVKFDINVCSRLDYGRFSATGTLKFVRCNSDDLLVGGVFIDSQKFEQVVSRLRGELGEPERGNYPHYVPTLVPYLDNARLTNEDYKEISGLIWELAIGDNLRGKEYAPDRNNKVQNTLILGLVDQIAARINLYKQINFLVS